MKLSWKVTAVCAVRLAILQPALGQTDAEAGLAVPLTLSAGVLHTHRLQGYDRSASVVNGGFRAMAYPSVKLNKHVFGYAAIQVRSTPYFYYDSYSPKNQVKTDLIQAFAGYTGQIGKASIVIKGGKLASAFGSFPLRYDDTENPLLDQPLSYVTQLRLRPDQLPCGVSDLLHQAAYYYEVNHYCGGSGSYGHGIEPVTLYGLPGVQADVAGGGFDARIQVTNSSPANPHGLRSASQHPQWTAGGGFTFRRQVRIGVSSFRGPYLDRGLRELLPAGKGLRDYPAAAFAIDGQGSKGRWTVLGEWQRFRFTSPRFVEHPGVSSGYIEVKAIVTPRLYLAGRATYLRHSRISDVAGRSAASFAPSLQSHEFAFGYRINRSQLLKTGYQWLKTQGLRGAANNVLGIQFVTSIDGISKAWR
jgi:hypothetical protein